MKTSKKVFVLFFLFLLVEVQAQNKISIAGKVFEEQKGTKSKEIIQTPLVGVTIQIKGEKKNVATDINGLFRLDSIAIKSTLIISYIGYKTQEIKLKGDKLYFDIKLEPETDQLEEVVIVGYGTQSKKDVTGSIAYKHMKVTGSVERAVAPQNSYDEYNQESYSGIVENEFKETGKNPISTFSIDVDGASYSNCRRFLNLGQKPPKDAVRVEEFINYFAYDYPQPSDEHPFSINSEYSECPWNKKHNLLVVGLQGKAIPTDNLPASNLVFLIDVSGSMNAENKLPLLKSAFKLLVKQLRKIDKVAIVVYAGAAGLILPPTSGDQKDKIIEALDDLSAGGSTAGGQGIKLAYKVAQENFIKEGNNRVILATDGDFNVGMSSDDDMEKLIEEKRESGVFFTSLGFGMGNYKDSKMEKLANKGNGNYSYIDNIQEARKVFVNEFGGTLFTIAKDVKIQIEFNPTKVKSYRLLGYENRMLNREDFDNDKKDAGELGSGHTVTAIYEIEPGNVSTSKTIDSLRYQSTKVNEKAAQTNELLSIKFRYKKPDGNKSILIEKFLLDKITPLNNTSDNFRFGASVAEFGILLRDSDFKADASYKQVVNLAENAKGKDAEGYRSEFVRIVKSFSLE